MSSIFKDFELVEHSFQEVNKAASAVEKANVATSAVQEVDKAAQVAKEVSLVQKSKILVEGAKVTSNNIISKLRTNAFVKLEKIGATVSNTELQVAKLYSENKKGLKVLGYSVSALALAGFMKKNKLSNPAEAAGLMFWNVVDSVLKGLFGRKYKQYFLLGLLILILFVTIKEV